MSIAHEEDFNDEEEEEMERIETEHDSVCISLPVKLLAKIDAIRGDVKRSTWIARKLEDAVFPQRLKLK